MFWGDRSSQGTLFWSGLAIKKRTPRNSLKKIIEMPNCTGHPKPNISSRSTPVTKKKNLRTRSASVTRKNYLSSWSPKKEILLECSGTFF